ncbi:unnamed protein product [marine sediment metagenome]|uniref:Uncharacterized protein n=1 Tax=marine sediment metagenome TaxID=412755 RepID=X1F516_9ZZZZ
MKTTIRVPEEYKPLLEDLRELTKEQTLFYIREPKLNDMTSIKFDPHIKDRSVKKCACGCGILNARRESLTLDFQFDYLAYLHLCDVPVHP